MVVLDVFFEDATVFAGACDLGDVDVEAFEEATHGGCC